MQKLVRSLFHTLFYNMNIDVINERYNTYAKSCNSSLYTKHEQCHLHMLIFRTIVYNVNLYQTMHFYNVKIWF